MKRISKCVVMAPIVGVLAWPLAANAAENSPISTPKSRSLSVEAAPSNCPTTGPAARIHVPGTVASLCTESVKGATSGVAGGALRYAFAHLGSAYTYTSRDSVSPPLFDCSSFVGRAFTAAGGKITRKGQPSQPFYPLMSYTGSYIPSMYSGTNLSRVSQAELIPGDIIIQFKGADPATSSGANGHEQLYIGSGNVIQSTPEGVNVARHRLVWTDEWFFRLDGTTAPSTPTPPAAPAGPVFLSADARLGVRSDSVRSLQLALIKTQFATAALRGYGATSMYGNATQASVRNVQLSMGYRNKDADGILGPYSAARLGLTWRAG